MSLRETTEWTLQFNDGQNNISRNAMNSREKRDNAIDDSFSCRSFTHFGKGAAQREGCNKNATTSQVAV
jgi:hypothetical protein